MIIDSSEEGNEMSKIIKLLGIPSAFYTWPSAIECVGLLFVLSCFGLVSIAVQCG